jgi:periplasmic divalent cation tolerance protein
MTDKVVVFITSPNLKESRKIARVLVEAKLAACVNICSPVQSVYRWKGKVEQAREYLLVVKSNRELFPKLQAAVSTLHSYKIPEIICLPIVDGSLQYLQWLDDSLGTD